MLCRVALGVDGSSGGPAMLNSPSSRRPHLLVGVDYDFDAASGKYSVKWPAQVMPTYMVYFQ